MSILESLHAERPLSLNHWRYRLLHWACGIKNVETVEDAVKQGMRRFFYEKYCPLFHLTNLILIFSWLILIVKVLIRIFFGLVHVFEKVGRVVRIVIDMWNMLIPKKNEKENVEKTENKIDTETLRKKDRKKFISMLNEAPSVKLQEGNAYFPFLWSYVIAPPKDVFFLSKEEAKEIFDKFVPIILENRRLQEEKSKRRYENMMFYINFSRVFFKGILNGIYITLGVFVLWLLWALSDDVLSIGLWVLKLFYYIFTGVANYGLLATVLYMIQIILMIVFCILCVYLVYRIFKKQFETIIGTILDGFSSLFLYIGKIIDGTLDFVSTFYADNCPPIKIISEEEEIIQ